MRSILTLFVLATAVNVYAGEPSASQPTDPLAAQIMQLERSALERWNNGDPSGYIEILADDVGYFDPALEQRLDGKAALADYYEPVRGKVHADKYEMLNPKVQAVKDMAVLTYNLISVEGQKTWRWNSTEVYRLESDGKWRIIQSHWSLTRPEMK